MAHRQFVIGRRLQLPNQAEASGKEHAEQRRWSWPLALFFWPFVALAVLPWGVLGALFLIATARASHRRNRGEDSYLDMESEIGIAWVPVVTTIGAFGITAGFTFDDLSRGVPYAVASVVLVIALSVQFVRQVGLHRNGQSPSIYSPDVDPKAALASLEKQAAAADKVWLIGVAEYAVSDGGAGDGESSQDLRSFLTVSNVLKRSVSAVKDRHKFAGAVVLFWTGGLGYLAWNSPESKVALWVLSAVALGSFLSLAVVTYVDKVIGAFQANARAQVLQIRLDEQRATSTPKSCVECETRESSRVFHSKTAKVLARLSGWFEDRVGH